MHWDSKLLLSREATSLTRPLFYCRRGGLIRVGQLYLIWLNEKNMSKRKKKVLGIVINY
jgi:hypothetical protein